VPLQETFQQIEGLFGGDRQAAEEACARIRALPREEVAAWLAGRVANPAAERYLLELLFGQAEDTLADNQACHSFCRELAQRLRPRLRRELIEAGEISQVLELVGQVEPCWRHPQGGGPMPVVYKKMPAFLHRNDAEVYVERYMEYNALLRDEVGIAVPHFDARIVERQDRVIIYVVQERVEPASVCHIILHEIGPAAAERLYRAILGELGKLHRYNRDHAAQDIQVGLDGQIPNWAVANYGGDANALTEHERLVYLDTNVPMMRIAGRDVIDTDMYFQALPGIARWLLKRLSLDQEVMDRYYQMRLILLDFLGNIMVRSRPDLVPRLIEVSNEALAGPFGAGEMVPFTAKEVEQYYHRDVSIWRLWRSLKVIGAVSDGVSSGQWRSLGRLAEIYGIWTKPIF
jgi:hypothetical protein